MVLITKRIDTRRLSCPQQVILVDRSVAEGHVDMEVFADNEAAREDALPITHKRGLKTEVSQEGADIIVCTTKP